MKISRGDIIIVHNLSHGTHSTPIAADTDFELKDNSIMLYNDYLCCVEATRVNENGMTIIEVHEQDAVVVKDGYLYKSLNDLY